MKTLQRILKSSEHSFFLFGPRGTGKSTWLKQQYKDSIYIDLLKTDVYLDLARHPDRLEGIVFAGNGKGPVIIDEVQRVPELLNEVHRLIESQNIPFGLCGSSARKLKRGGGNLLAGRALPVYMEGFCFAELPSRYDDHAAIEWGMLPLVVQRPEASADILSAYVDMYIKEEITQEGLVRRLPPFLRFIEVAGLLNGQCINASNIAREAGVPRSSVDTYFSLLEDTMMGHFLPAYVPNVKVREQKSPKFYWFDPGVARAAAGLLYESVADPIWKGTALETLLFHELRVYNQACGRHAGLFHHRTPADVEIDFVIETRKRRLNTRPCITCIEVKTATKWQRKWEKPMREMNASDRVEVARMIGVYTGTQRYHFDGVDVLPLQEFLAELYAGTIV